jgi:hypothetical protein
VCKQKKKIRLNNKIKQIEEAHKQSNARKSFQGEKPIGVLACRDEDGKLIFEQEGILESWEQFFRTLMKTDKKFECNKGLPT